MPVKKITKTKKATVKKTVKKVAVKKQAVKTVKRTAKKPAVVRIVRKAIKRTVKRKLAGNVFPLEKVEALIKKATFRGFITYSEILYSFPGIEKDIKGLEEFFLNLEEKGIEVKEPKSYLDTEKTTKKSKSRLDPRIDSVQMYLKEIGKIPFLTSAQEKEIGQKIEMGEDQA